MTPGAALFAGRSGPEPVLFALPPIPRLYT